MKLLYKILLFFVVFYGVVIFVNSLNIFPNTLYGDSDKGILGNIFIPGSIGDINFTWVATIAGIITGGAIITGFLTQNIQIPAITVLGVIIFNMITNSWNFVTGVFYKFNNRPDSLVYLGACIGAAVVVVGLITVIESVLQGGSGGDD